MHNFLTGTEVVLRGYAGGDPELQYIPSGVAVVSFGVGVGGGRDKPGQFFTVKAWRGLAEAVNQQVHKGSALTVKGYLSTRVVGEGDSRRRYTDIVAQEIGLMVSGTECQWIEFQKDGEGEEKREEKKSEEKSKPARVDHTGKRS